MPKPLSLILLCALIGAPFAAFGEPKIPSISAEDAAKLAQAGKATIVDVREQDEIDVGMAAPAKWFPISKIESSPEKFQAFLAALPKKSKVVFYCASGGRAGRAAEQASRLGYDTANMGGYSSWKAAKLPTKTP